MRERQKKKKKKMNNIFKFCPECGKPINKCTEHSWNKSEKISFYDSPVPDFLQTPVRDYDVHSDENINLFMINNGEQKIAENKKEVVNRLQMGNMLVEYYSRNLTPRARNVGGITTVIFRCGSMENVITKDKQNNIALGQHFIVTDKKETKEVCEIWGHINHNEIFIRITK